MSSLPGVEHGPLHYRSLERDKSNALRENKGNFGSSVTLSPSSRAELNWWITTVDTSHKLISHGEPELLIQTELLIQADRGSRHFNDRTEWKLEPTIYHSITERFGQPSTDLFASRLNKQCSVYASWRPDRDGLFVDAFSANWSNFFLLCFPSF